MDAGTQWATKLEEMEGWYRDLLASGTAEAFLQTDYAPHAEFLSGLSGRILDLGGGAGVAGRYLPPECDHVVIDPAAVWAEPEWRDLGARFSGGRGTTFIRGTGEALPLAAGEFDGAIAFWSLNHAQDPNDCINELARVVRPGGTTLLVLEDMEPSWADFALCVRQRVGALFGGGVDGFGFFESFRASALHKLSGKPWPLQDDHCRILEADLLQWTAPHFRLVRRQWLGGFLTLEFARR